MDDCIFCKIIKGEIPSYTIYEDDIIKVFLDINPSTNGHCLIVPKKHYANILDIDKDTLHYINDKSVELYKLLKERLNCDGLTLTQNNDHGQDVKHYHLHITPRYKNDNFNHSFNKESLLDIEKVHEILTK